MSIAHVIIIIKSEVSTFPIVIIFFRGCVPEMFLHNSLSIIAYTFRENREFVFIIIVQFMMSADIRKRFGLHIFLFFCTVHHLIIIIVQTYLKASNLYNSCQIYFVECVSKIKHILSIIHYTLCGAVCFQFIHFPCDDWENIYIYTYFVLLSS